MWQLGVHHTRIAYRIEVSKTGIRADGGQSALHNAPSRNRNWSTFLSASSTKYSHALPEAPHAISLANVIVESDRITLQYSVNRQWQQDHPQQLHGALQDATICRTGKLCMDRINFSCTATPQRRV